MYSFGCAWNQYGDLFVYSFKCTFNNLEVIKVHSLACIIPFGWNSVYTTILHAQIDFIDSTNFFISSSGFRKVFFSRNTTAISCEKYWQWKRSHTHSGLCMISNHRIFLLLNGKYLDTEKRRCSTNRSYCCTFYSFHLQASKLFSVENFALNGWVSMNAQSNAQRKNHIG